LTNAPVMGHFRADQDLAAQLIEEVFDGDYVVQRLLCFRYLEWN